LRKERERARRAGDEEEEGKAGPAEIGWKTLPTHTLDLGLGRHKSRSPTMVRQFKHHEQKLLKKVDFLNVRHPLAI
jgi:hypothetical protein